jgi:hypothetical protein
MDNTVVDHIRDPESRRIDFVPQFPQSFMVFDSERNMVKDEGSRHRVSVVFFRNGLHFRPFEKNNEILQCDFEKIELVTALPHAGNHSHAEQITPEADSLVHISGCHCQVMNALEPEHRGIPSMMVTVIN